MQNTTTTLVPDFMPMPQVRVLGAVSVVAHDPVDHRRSGMTEVGTYLALRATECDSDELDAAMWSDEDTRPPMYRRHAVLSRLRRW